MTIEQQLTKIFGLQNPHCKSLNTLANYAIEVTDPNGQYALKLYHDNRTREDVQWELDLTIHLIRCGVPVAKPIQGKNGYLQTITFDGVERTALLFVWAPGEKPKPKISTYLLLGAAAAQLHQAADTFSSSLKREKYDIYELIDEQLERMKEPLHEIQEWQRMYDLAERLKAYLTKSKLDYGICHMDLTLDNIHLNEHKLTIFDLDSAAESFRAIEPYGIKISSEPNFQAWLEGYRSIRNFSNENEKAVAVFGIVGEIRNVVWKLGLANSSRGNPLMRPSELAKVIDEWLEWEKKHIAS